MQGLRIVGACAAALALLPAAAAAAAPELRLAPGRPVFWSGPAGGSACGAGCWEWTLDVQPGGTRLRAGIDHATLDDLWTVTILDPAGSERASFGPGDSLYSMEDTIRPAPAGRWKLRVTGERIDDPRFRLRALLERAAKRASRVRDELPNLRALPPWDLSFRLPLTNGGTPGPSAGLDLPGGRAACHPEELVEEGVRRCLRMAFGVSNAGTGPMDLHYRDDGTTGTKVLYQRIVRSDSSSYERIAGTAVYHRTHGHYHHAEAVSLELLRVADMAAGVLVPAATERRKGFAHRDELLRDWHRFHPLRGKQGFGLQAGWGDYYEWDRPGNFVDFGLNGDGRYVIRMRADPGGGVLESDESDNLSYSLIEVDGERIQVLESGRGSGPWDRCKLVLPIGPEPEPPAQPPRPAACPAA